MPTFDVEQEEITAFEFEQKYLFKQYFDKNDLFQKLEQYYNSDKFRFEVPEEDLSKVRQILDNFFYKLKTTDDLINYCVVLEKRADSSDILKNSIANQRKGDYQIHLMKDEISVRQTIEKEAIRLEEADLRKENLQW